MAQPRYERQQFFQSVSGDTGAGEVARGLAQAFGTVGNIAQAVGQQAYNEQQELNREFESAQEELAQQNMQMQKLEAPQRKREGVLAGQQARREGIQGDEILPGLDVGSQAFNEGFVSAYIAESKMDARSKFLELSNDFKDDPQEFKNQANAYINGAVGGMPDELALPMQAELMGILGSVDLQVQKDFLKAERDKQVAIRQADRDLTFDEISTTARNDGNTKPLMASYFDDIDSDVNSGLLSATQAEKEKNIALQTVSEQKYLSVVDSLLDNIDKAQGIKDAEAFLIETATDDIPNVTPTQRDLLIGKAQVLINRRKVQIQGQATKISNEAKKALKDYQTAKQLGYEVSPTDVDKVYNLVEGNEDLTRQLVTIENTAAFAVLPSQNRRDIINYNAGGDLESVQHYQAFVKSNAQINKAAQEDVYALGVAQGVIENIPFDPSDPNSLEQKIQQQGVLEEHYQVPGTPFSNAEVDAMTAQLTEMTVPEKVQLAQTLQAAPNVWQQFDKKNASTFAMAGASGDQDVMTAVFTGQEMLANKLATIPSTEDYMNDFDKYVEGVYGIDDKAAVLKTTLNHYAATRKNQAVYSKDEFEKSLEAVTGGIAKINGFKIELPRGVLDSRFEDYIDDLTTDTIESLGGVLGMSNYKAIDVIQSSRLVNNGGNEYLVEHDNGTLQKADGSGPFIFKYDLDWDAQQKAAFEPLESRRLEKILTGMSF